MTVCLHCGELGPDGALFCSKCGYTLPQVDLGTSAPPRAPVAPPPMARPVAPPIPGAIAPPGAYAFPAAAPVAYVAPLPAGALGPIPPPPGGKYCTRCGTIILRAAVYCPVCQQPQS